MKEHSECWRCNANGRIGPSNDKSESVAIEIRAAELAISDAEVDQNDKRPSDRCHEASALDDSDPGIEEDLPLDGDIPGTGDDGEE